MNTHYKLKRNTKDNLIKMAMDITEEDLYAIRESFFNSLPKTKLASLILLAKEEEKKIKEKKDVEVDNNIMDKFIKVGMTIPNKDLNKIKHKLLDIFPELKKSAPEDLLVEEEEIEEIKSNLLDLLVEEGEIEEIEEIKKDNFEDINSNEFDREPNYICNDIMRQIWSYKIQFEILDIETKYKSEMSKVFMEDWDLYKDKIKINTKEEFREYFKEQKTISQFKLINNDTYTLMKHKIEYKLGTKITDLRETGILKWNNNFDNFIINADGKYKKYLKYLQIRSDNIQKLVDKSWCIKN